MNYELAYMLLFIICCLLTMFVVVSIIWGIMSKSFLFSCYMFFLLGCSTLNTFFTFSLWKGIF